MMKKLRTYSEMISLCKYFERNIQNNPLFEPEFKVSQKINDEIEKLMQLSPASAIRIVDLFNEINQTEHYNGTGRLDHKMHLIGLLSTNGCKTESTGPFLQLSW